MVSYWDTVIEDDLNETYSGKSMNVSEIEYVSSKSRSIFFCPAEDSGLLKTVRESFLVQ